MGYNDLIFPRRRTPLCLSPLGKVEYLPRKQHALSLSCFHMPAKPSCVEVTRVLLMERVLAWHPS